LGGAQRTYCHAPSSRQEELARAHRQQRVAFAASVFVLALLGLGLAGRWRSRAATFGAALALLVLYGVCFGVGAGPNNGAYPSTYGTWTANGAFLGHRPALAALAA
jgi:lipopolysaccharide export LptBFGC system permease protein LptF